MLFQRKVIKFSTNFYTTPLNFKHQYFRRELAKNKSFMTCWTCFIESLIFHQVNPCYKSAKFLVLLGNKVHIKCRMTPLLGDCIILCYAQKKSAILWFVLFSTEQCHKFKSSGKYYCDEGNLTMLQVKLRLNINFRFSIKFYP